MVNDAMNYRNARNILNKLPFMLIIEFMAQILFRIDEKVNSNSFCLPFICLNFVLFGESRVGPKEHFTA